ncbi:MAG: hypothetical protein U9Q07_03895 [Planctomycetota bacterium]|nr:hypothetical protein [Planctomycetota bacterium]
MKLSKTQHAVLVKMANGWTLRQDRSMVNLGAWLHRGGLGGTREEETIRITTFRALREAEFIEIERDGWPSRTYKLTTSGIVASAREV